LLILFVLVITLYKVLILYVTCSVSGGFSNPFGFTECEIKWMNEWTNEHVNQEGRPSRESNWLCPPTLIGSQPTMNQGLGHVHTRCVPTSEVFCFPDDENGDGSWNTHNMHNTTSKMFAQSYAFSEHQIFSKYFMKTYLLEYFMHILCSIITQKNEIFLVL
jgi:hypothetical protein